MYRFILSVFVLIIYGLGAKMRKPVLLIGAFLSVMSSAQLVPDTEPPDVRSFRNLLTAIASGYNYYCLIPLQSGTSDVQIDNLAQNDNDVLVIGELSGGFFNMWLLSIPVQDNAILGAGELNAYDRIFLISMQPFHVQADQPIYMFGLKTRHFPTVLPTRSLELMAVRGPLGREFIVGVTPDGTVHYPVFGRKFGFFDVESRSVIKEDGVVLEELR